MIVKSWQSILVTALLRSQLLLVMFTAWLVAGLIWNLAGPAPAVIVPDFSDTAPVSRSQSSALSQSGSGGMLFGDYQAPVQEEVPAEDIPVTRLSLSLKGVFASDDPRSGSAIIGNSRNESVFVVPGDTIFDQALLEQIYTDRVILSRSGRLETLYFEQSKGQVVAGSAAGQSSDQVRTVNNNPVVSGNSVAQVVDTLKTQAYEDPQALVRQFGLSEGEDGYLVTRRARQLMFIGLRPGDRITAVNNIPVGNAASDVALLDQAVPGAEVKIDIVRGNRQFSIYQTIPNL